MAREGDEARDDDGDEPVRDRPSVATDTDETTSRVVLPNGGLDRYDRIFTALSTRRRRYVLYYLERTEPATIREIGRHVAAWETDTPPPAIDEDSETVQHVLISLYHDHLPRLDDLRFVEYDSRSGDVRFRDCPEPLLEIVDLCRPRELPDPVFDPG